MDKISKNARSGIKVEKFLHKNCDGELKMHTIFAKGKMKHIAMCEECGEVARRPSLIGYKA